MREGYLQSVFISTIATVPLIFWLGPSPHSKPFVTPCVKARSGKKRVPVASIRHNSKTARSLSLANAALRNTSQQSSALTTQTPDIFKDVDADHWAYGAVENLRAKNILIGYPDQYFHGKRTLTRYEFSVALDRAIKSIGSGPAGERGPEGRPGEPGEPGATGPQGPPGASIIASPVQGFIHVVSNGQLITYKVKSDGSLSQAHQPVVLPR